MANKWFYGLSDQVSEKLRKIYGEDNVKGCDFQVVTQLRVIEQWTVFRDNKIVQIYVSMIRRTQAEHTLLIFEINLVASN